MVEAVDSLDFCGNLADFCGQLTDLGKLGDFLSGIFAALTFPIVIFGTYVTHIEKKAKKEEIKKNPNLNVSEGELKLILYVTHIPDTIFGQMPNSRISQNFKREKKFLESKFEELKRRLELSKNAKKWLAYNTERLAREIGESVLFNHQEIRYYSQIVYKDEELKELFCLDIKNYLELICRCLSTLRSNPIDNMDKNESNKELISPFLDVNVYKEAFSLLRNYQPPEQELSKEAFEQIQIYLDYLISTRFSV